MTFEIGLRSINGYIDPNGRFYMCKFSEHVSIADKLVDQYYGYSKNRKRKISKSQREFSAPFNAQQFLEEHGWMHISDGKWVNAWLWLGKDISQRQLDSVFDWAVANFKTKSNFPDWVISIFNDNNNKMTELTKEEKLFILNEWSRLSFANPGGRWAASNVARDDAEMIAIVRSGGMIIDPKNDLADDEDWEDRHVKDELDPDEPQHDEFTAEDAEDEEEDIFASTSSGILENKYNLKQFIANLKI